MSETPFFSPTTTRNRLLSATAGFLVLGHNAAFFKQVLTIYPFGDHLLFLASLAVVLLGLHLLLLNLLVPVNAAKPVFWVLFPASAACQYFMWTYGTVMDTHMVQNVFESNTAEAGDLLSLKLLGHVLVLGVLPAAVVHRVRLAPVGRGQALRSLALGAAMSLVLMVLPLFGFNRWYASFFREHKPLRYFANPVNPLVSLVRYGVRSLRPPPGARTVIAPDAAIPETDDDRELVIMVVGETARADHFSLNGYGRDTNPLLAKEQVVSFRDVTACGTSTAVSVPCMFSMYTREDFSNRKADATENVLDILARAGVHVLWRDNNSDSKGVAEQVTFEDWRTPERNPECDVECRDVGMLDGLAAVIDAVPDGDILIVLHQMGNHGPAYYKRYPPEFERFTPTCRSNQLQDCDPEAIRNAYDNALLYTDYFLSRVIDFLKGYDHAPFETAMVYMGDHGESLGEHGLYLHGMPYFMAPEAQTKVPLIFWFGQGFEISASALTGLVDQPVSQDHLFHGLLHLFEVEADIYNPDLDLFHGIIPPE